MELLGDEEGQEVGASPRLVEDPSLSLELVFQEKAAPLWGVYHLLELKTAPGWPLRAGPSPWAVARR